MLSAVQRFANISLEIPLQFEDATAAALRLGHFATKSVLGLHVTHVLDGTTEADPGISNLALSEAVRNAAASCQTRRIMRQTCGSTTSAVKQPPVARDAKEWHRFRAPVEITPLLKDEVFDGTSQFTALSAVLNNTKQTNSGAQLLYPYVRYLPNASKKHFLTARPKGSKGPGGRWYGFRKRVRCVFK